MKVSQIAINSASTIQNDLEGALAAYAAAGFRNVELNSELFRLVKERARKDGGSDDVRRFLAEHDLQVIGGAEEPVECFVSPEARRANLELQVEQATLICELGGGTLVVGTDGPSEPSLEALDNVAGALRELAERIEGLGVNVALEFNWSPLIRSLQSAVLVAEKVRHQQVGVLFDPAHYYTTPTKLEHLTADAVGWIKHVHLNDMSDKPGDLAHRDFDRVLPGQGVLDLETIIATIERHGYERFFSIELFSEELWRLPAEEAARRCYKSLLPLCVDGGTGSAKVGEERAKEA